MFVSEKREDSKPSENSNKPKYTLEYFKTPEGQFLFPDFDTPEEKYAAYLEDQDMRKSSERKMQDTMQRNSERTEDAEKFKEGDAINKLEILVKRYSGDKFFSRLVEVLKQLLNTEEEYTESSSFDIIADRMGSATVREVRQPDENGADAVVREMKYSELLEMASKILEACSKDPEFKKLALEMLDKIKVISKMDEGKVTIANDLPENVVSIGVPMQEKREKTEKSGTELVNDFLLKYSSNEYFQTTINALKTLVAAISLEEGQRRKSVSSYFQGSFIAKMRLLEEGTVKEIKKFNETMEMIEKAEIILKECWSSPEAKEEVSKILDKIETI